MISLLYRFRQNLLAVIFTCIYCSARIPQLIRSTIEFQDISNILLFHTISFISHPSTLCSGWFVVMPLHVFFETPCGEQPKTHFTVYKLPMVTESLSMQ